MLVNFRQDSVYSPHHIAMDQGFPYATIFLHEDLLARTLMYERDLQQWRLAHIRAGMNDPGRPSYNEVSGDLSLLVPLSGVLGVRWL